MLNTKCYLSMKLYGFLKSAKVIEQTMYWFLVYMMMNSRLYICSVRNIVSQKPACYSSAFYLITILISGVIFLREFSNLLREGKCLDYYFHLICFPFVAGIQVHHLVMINSVRISSTTQKPMYKFGLRCLLSCRPHTLTVLL